jgi:DNA-binding transcriptional regulator YhcF (GntR family)
MRAKPSGLQPKYAQVAEVLRADIAAGVLAVGEMLPTEAELGLRHGVSRITVRGALQHLEAAGLISREQGKGTFVARRRPVENRRDPGLLHVLFLLIDVTTEDDYNYREIQTTERYLSKRGIPFSWASLTTEDLVHGHLPAVLEKGLCQGILLDGHVTDSHFALGDRFGVKVLAVGNHTLSPGLPQVRANITDAVRRMVHTLAEGGRRKVILAIEPLRLAMTHEVHAGYAAALADRVQDEQLVYICPDDVPPPGLIRLLTAQPEAFALFTTQEIYPRVAEALRKANVGTASLPLCLMVTRPFSPTPYVQLHQLCFKAEEAQTLAVERLLDLVQGRRDAVYEAIDVEYLPPSRIGLDRHGKSARTGGITR